MLSSRKRLGVIGATTAFVTGVVAMLAAALPASALAQGLPAPGEIRGTWSGLIEDTRVDDYTLELALWLVQPGRQLGVTRYPDSGCTGRLVPLAGAELDRLPPLVRRPGSAAPLWLREEPEPAGRCDNAGLVALTVVRSHPMLGLTLRWERVDARGEVLAEGELLTGFVSAGFRKLIEARLAQNPPMAAASAPPPAAVAAAPRGNESATTAPSPAPGAVPPPMDLRLMRQAALGEHEGTLGDCAVPRRVTLSLREKAAQPYSDVVYVEGRLLVGPAGAGSGAGAGAGAGGASLAFESAVSGRLRSATAMVTLETEAEAPAQGGALQGLASAARRLLGRDGRGDSGARAPWRRVTMAFVREPSGAGWVGQVDDAGFGCRELALRRSDGTRSDVVRAPTVDEAWRLAGLATGFVLEDDAVPAAEKLSPTKPVRRLTLAPPERSTEPWMGAPWLRLAADLGSVRAAALLGRIYEHGLGLPRDPERAAAFHARAAAADDPSGLRAMARLHARGEAGVARDAARSAALEARAEQVMARARRVCASQPVLEQAGSLMMANWRMQSRSLLNIALQAAMDRQQVVEIGALVVERVEPVAVSSPGAPLSCRITARRVDARVTDHTPYRRWRHEDRHGNVLFYTDNEEDRSWNRLEAELKTLGLNNLPAVEIIEAAPLSADAWRLTLLDSDPYESLARSVFVDVRMNVPPIGARP